MALALLNTNNTQVVALVNAIFNVAPGYTYLSNFAGYAAQNGVAKTADALAGLAGQTDAAFTTSLIANLGLTGEAATVATAYFTARFAAKASQGTVAMEAVTYLASAAAKADATFGAAATAFAATVERSEIYSTNSANTSTDLTVLANAAAGKLPQAFPLTAGDNTFNGGNGDDTFSAASGTYDVSRDKLDGGAGSDTLSVTMASADITPASKNIEKLSFLMTDGTAGLAETFTVTLDATKATGVNTVEFYNYNGSTAATEDTAAVADLTTQTVRLVSGSNYKASVALKDAAGTADTVTVDLEDAAAKTLTVNGVETININSVGTATAGNVLSSGLSGDALTKLVVTGTAKANLGTVSDISATKSFALDATANAAGVTLISSHAAVTGKTFTANFGAGNDALTLEAGDIDADTGTTRYYSVDFGAGTDTIAFSDAVTSIEANLKKGLASFANFEKVRFNSAETALDLDAAGFAGKTVVLGNASIELVKAKSGVVIELANAVTVLEATMTGAGSKTATINLAGNSLTLVGDAGTDNANTLVGVNTLTIDNTKATTAVATVTDLNEYAGAVLNLTGNQAITVVAGLGAETVTVNAETMTKALTLATSASGTLLNTGAGADVLTISGVTAIDEINTGAGDDQIDLVASAGAGASTAHTDVIADTINGGDGIDTVRIMGDANDPVTTDLRDAVLTSIEKLVVDFGDGTVGPAPLLLSAAQSIQFAGATAITNAELSAAAGTDTATPVSTTIKATETAASGTAMVDTLVVAAANKGFSASNLKANDLVDLSTFSTNGAHATADWASTATNALSDVNAAGEWYFTGDTLTVWDTNEAAAVNIVMVGVKTIVVHSDADMFKVTALD